MGVRTWTSVAGTFHVHLLFHVCVRRWSFYGRDPAGTIVGTLSPMGSDPVFIPSSTALASGASQLPCGMA